MFMSWANVIRYYQNVGEWAEAHPGDVLKGLIVEGRRVQLIDDLSAGLLQATAGGACEGQVSMASIN